MGRKGDRLTGVASEAAKELVERLQPLGHVTSKKMFGGYGIFEGGKMFALVNSGGDLFLKADDTNTDRFEAAHSERHGRMPYYAVPPTVFEDDRELLAWAQTSIAVARS